MIDNDFDIPRATEVPPAVQARIEAKVMSGIRRTSHSRVWIITAVAAVVTVCGVVTATLGANSADPPPANRPVDPPVPALPEAFPPAMPSAQAGYEMDRCALAIQQLPNKAQYPDRRTWQSLVVVGTLRSRLSAIRADGRLLFCETSLDKVTVSAPDGKSQPLPGTTAGIMLVTASGAIAGTTDPSWPKAIVQEGDGHDTPAQRMSGMFFTLLGTPVNSALTLRGQDNGDKVALPKTLGTTIDHAPYPPADRTSDRGRMLRDCMAKVNGEVPDADLWQAGAMAEAGDERVIMATNPAGTSACYEKGQTATFATFLARNSPKEFPSGVVPLAVAPTLGGRTLVAGSAANNVAEMRLKLPNKRSMDADVANNSFAVLLPSDVLSSTQVTTTLYDAAGDMLETGPDITSRGMMIDNN